MDNSTKFWERLFSVLNAININEAAERLDMNASTLRGRKARGAIPYEKIVQKLNNNDLLYVLKGRHNLNENNAKEGLVAPSFKAAKSDLERFLVEFTRKIKGAPFSKQAKLRIVDLLLHIVEENIEEIS